VLLVAPWSDFWEHNYFMVTRPALGAVLQDDFVRGAVTGVGALTILAGLAELGAVLAGRRETDQSAGPG
jgi:hypothetical protein